VFINIGLILGNLKIAISRRGSASELKKSESESKKPPKSKSSDTKKSKIYECDVCKAEVEDGDDALECEICKGWFHIS